MMDADALDRLFRDYGDMEVRLDTGRVVTRPISECRACAALVDSSWEARDRHARAHLHQVMDVLR